MSGRGIVYSFTVVNREFAPGIKPPYVVALVDLEEQEGLRLVTNLVNVTIGDVRIGMPVRVVFSHDIEGEEVTLAFFEPERSRERARATRSWWPASATRRSAGPPGAAKGRWPSRRARPRSTTPG